MNTDWKQQLENTNTMKRRRTLIISLKYVDVSRHHFRVKAITFTNRVRSLLK